MKKYIKAVEEAVIIETYETEHAIVNICGNDLLYGEENERAKQTINDFIFDALHRQAEKEARKNLV